MEEGLITNNPAALQNLFNEPVYAINTMQDYLVIVEYADQDIPEHVKEAFYKIFQALGVKENRYRLFNKGRQHENEINAGNFKNVLLMGAAPPEAEHITAPEKYKPVKLNHKLYMKADKMDVILQDKSLKKQFWDTLKQM